MPNLATKTAYAPTPAAPPRLAIERLWFRVACGSLIATCIAVRVLESLGSPWNVNRFARAYALAHGMDLYTPADSGVIAGLIYGPVGYFLYAPAALWTSPIPAIATASLLSALATLGPAALVLYSCNRTGISKSWVLPVFTVLVLHFYASEATAGVWMIHTDAAALGLTCLALFWTLRHPLEQTLSWSLLAAAACAALAVWAKQTTAPILIVPSLYLFFAGCRAGAIRVFALTSAIAAVLGVLFGVLYGFGDLWLTMVEVPSRHAQFPGAPLLDWRLVTQFMEILFLLGVVVAGSAALRTGSEKTGPWESRETPALLERWQEFAKQQSGWVVYCATGLALLPMGILGRMKMSGNSNNFGLTDYFLALGIALLFLQFAARDEMRMGAGRRAVEAALLLLLAALGLRTAAQSVVAGHAVAAHWPPAVQVAYDYAQANPGATYFLYHPLVNLMAEGHYDHAAWGVLEREAAGFPVSDAHLRAQLPQNMQRLAVIDEQPAVEAIRSHNWDNVLLRKLPEFRCSVDVPALPGWAVLERGPEMCDPSNAAQLGGADR